MAISPGQHTLALSVPLSLTSLVRVAAADDVAAVDTWPATCARSYDGHAWELLPSTCAAGVALGACDASGCAINIPAVTGFTFYVLIRSLSSAGAAASAYTSTDSAWYDRVAANLMLQATFGPTRGEVRNLSAALQQSASASGGSAEKPGLA